MKRCVWSGSLALALVSLAAAAILGCPAAARAQLPEWIVYNTDNSRLPHDDGYIFTILKGITAELGTTDTKGLRSRSSDM